MSELAHDEVPEAPAVALAGEWPNMDEAIADLSAMLGVPIAASDQHLAGATVADMVQGATALRELIAENERLRRETETLRQELAGARAAVAATAKRRGFW